MPLQNLEYVGRALDLVERAHERGIVLRILGSLAYRLHCPARIEFFEQMQRDLTDVDLVAAGEQRRQVRDLLTGLGYLIDQDLLVTSEGRRYAFSDSRTSMVVDVFFDELFFCHPIPLKERLRLDYPTITPTDLLLEKMQIVQINPKDVKDSLVLLLEHPLAPAETDAIDHNYIATLLARDWGFYHTVMLNLKGLADHLGNGALPPGEAHVVRRRLDELTEAIEKEPKTPRWKIRARIGTRVKWYQEVTEKSRTF